MPIGKPLAVLFYSHPWPNCKSASSCQSHHTPVFLATPFTTHSTACLLLHQIGTDLTYSQRILRYMSTCCCLGFFCSSCLEPEREAADRHWRGGCAFYGVAMGLQRE